MAHTQVHVGRGEGSKKGLLEHGRMRGESTQIGRGSRLVQGVRPSVEQERHLLKTEIMVETVADHHNPCLLLFLLLCDPLTLNVTGTCDSF